VQTFYLTLYRSKSQLELQIKTVPRGHQFGFIGSNFQVAVIWERRPSKRPPRHRQDLPNEIMEPFTTVTGDYRAKEYDRCL
jgi:hypothetical protein